MAIIEKAQPASFAGIKLLVDRIDVAWSHRFHFHEYPHRASAALEKLGRKPYEFRVSAVFDEGAKAFPNLYPVSLNALRQVFEEERSAELSLPTFGTINAFLVTNGQQWTANSLSGERCDLVFVEDASDVFTLEAQVELSEKAMEENLEAIFAFSERTYPPLGEFGELGDLTGIFEEPPDLFDSLDGAVRDLLAIRDQAELAGQLVEAKCLKVVNYCAEIERTVDAFKKPSGVGALEALKEIWATALKIANDVQGKDSPIVTFVVPVTMSVQEISTRVFGTSQRGFDVMQLNAIDDPMAVPAGTRIRYYADAA